MARYLNRETLRRWAPILVLLALIAAFSLANPNFLSVRNFARIAISATPLLMVAIGATFIILMGSIDLSMEGAVAVSATAFAGLFLALGGTVLGSGVLAIPLAIFIGMAFGFVTGLLHVKLRIPSFMASLAMSFVGIGIALLYTGGERVRIEDPTFRMLLTERFLGFPFMVWFAGVALLVAWFIQSRTTLGRHVFALGGGEELARASGLNVTRVRLAAFALAGAFYGLGALFAVARIGIAETVTGEGMMFLSITAVVVGGTALWGGIGGVWQTLVGVLLIHVIGNGMVVLGVPSFLQSAILGALIIAALWLSMDRRKLAFVK
jgi:ribose transport system permease protein